MSQGPAVTPQAALLRVLISGEMDGPELIRKVVDWTGGQIALDAVTFAAAIRDLEGQSLVESHAGATEKRSGLPRQTFALTAAGHKAAMEILAASLTRKG
jgi:DNA-binding PadR family transcriptional regulator